MFGPFSIFIFLVNRLPFGGQPHPDMGRSVLKNQRRHLKPINMADASHGRPQTHKR
jgi:hypothetical protein